MNIFESVICHDYTVVRTHREMLALKTNGIHMVGLAWVCNVLTLLGIGIVYLLLTNQSDQVYEILALIRYWEIAGRLGILIFLAVVYFMSFGAYGGKAIFVDIIKRFSKLEEAEKHAVARRGGMYFYFSLLFFFIVSGTVVYLIKYVY
ncbi:hypothetical protein [Sediminibacterium sp. TEGAF015]|uniref:hypothetical protein n=1 Tax=Sediminibacterium sp. TEGAF015 TaxID=575378 RepID=UPI0022089887|nr:hypothetical protein [Sediminibacterium sp. TEGAF015]BDQ12455.1 hypothetical protein TEGAF0_16720 [Sediminibacterium sp. TEGAF015]